MKKCNHAAYDACPLEERCPSFEEAFFLEGSECEKHNQDHPIDHADGKNTGDFACRYLGKWVFHKKRRYEDGR